MKKWLAGIVSVVVLLAAGLAFMSTRAPLEDHAAEVSFDDAALRVRIDVSERRLYVEKNGDRVGSYGVAVGTPEHPTPRGSYTIRSIIWNPRWVPPDSDWARDEKPRAPGDPKNPMGRVKIFFKEPTYYIHGTNSEGSIGTAASHGCVRMLNPHVIEVAKLLMEHSGAPVESGLIKRLINRTRQTREVRLTGPIPLRVQT